MNFMDRIKVTINPDGRNAKEIDWSVSGCSCFACIRIRERLRTFEIEQDYTEPGTSGLYIDYGPGHTVTAEILETGKVKIIS